MKSTITKCLVISILVSTFTLETNFAQEEPPYIIPKIDDQIKFDVDPFTGLPIHRVEKWKMPGKLKFDPFQDYTLQGTVWNVYDDTPIPSAASVYIDGSLIILDPNQSFEITLSGGAHTVEVVDPTREIWDYNQGFVINSDTIYVFKMLPKKVDIEVIDWACMAYHGNGYPEHYINNRYYFPVDVLVDTAGIYYPFSVPASPNDIARMRLSLEYWEETTGIDLFNEVDTLDLTDTTIYYIYVNWMDGIIGAAGTLLDDQNYPQRGSVSIGPRPNLPPDFYGGWTELHELGHALGFSHPPEGYDFLISSDRVYTHPTMLAPKEIQAMRAKALIDRGISLYTYGYRQYFSTQTVWPHYYYGSGAGVKVNLESLAYDPSRIIEPLADGYLLNGTILINTNDTLEINEGIKLYFEPNTRIRICGALIINGTPTDPVILDNAQSYKGAGIYFNFVGTDKQDDSRINYAEIKNFDVGLAYNQPGLPPPTGLKDLILKNVLLSGHVIGIWANRGSAIYPSGDLILTNCTLNSNEWGTILISVNNFISTSSNYTSSEKAGLFVQVADTFYFQYNNVNNNDAGVIFYNSLIYPRIVNEYKIMGENKINGLENVSDFTVVNKNNNYDNTQLNFSTGLADTIPSEYNWWGTTDPVQIESKLVGIIDYIPFLTEPYILSPPFIVSQLPDTSIIEDNYFTIQNLYTHFQDSINSLPLTFYSFSDNPSIVPDIEDSIKLVVTPNPNYFGDGNIIVTAENIFGLTIADTFYISVLPVNDPPMIVNLPDTLTFTADSSINVSIWEYVEDYETPDSLLIYQFTSANDSILLEYTEASGILLVYTQNNYSGSGLIHIRVEDDSSAFDEDSILIIVEPVTSIQIAQNEIPSEYILMQNYPNPFNPISTIKYGLPVKSNVQLTVYNILGEKIVELANEIQSAGYYELKWNANYMASGIYIYSLFAEAEDNSKNFRSIKKMVLLK